MTNPTCFPNSGLWFWLFFVLVAFISSRRASRSKGAALAAKFALDLMDNLEALGVPKPGPGLLVPLGIFKLPYVSAREALTALQSEDLSSAVSCIATATGKSAGEVRSGLGLRWDEGRPRKQGIYLLVAFAALGLLAGLLMLYVFVPME